MSPVPRTQGACHFSLGWQDLHGTCCPGGKPHPCQEAVVERLGAPRNRAVAAWLENLWISEGLHAKLMEPDWLDVKKNEKILWISEGLYAKLMEPDWLDVKKMRLNLRRN
jgi:hypothetical protein